MGDIARSSEGAVFIEQMQENMAKNSSMASMAEGVVITEQMRKMMMNLSVESLLKQDRNIELETVLEINRKLNRIKRNEDQ